MFVTVLTRGFILVGLFSNVPRHTKRELRAAQLIVFFLLLIFVIVLC